MLESLVVGLLWFIALYPPVTAAFWMAGGLIFHLYDEGTDVSRPPAAGWPPLTVVIPAYNEERVIGACVAAALALDYPEFEVVVLDDGSTDRTVSAAEQAGQGDPRLQIRRDDVNRGKAEQLNLAFGRARHELVIACDSDTHMHPLAPKLLVARMLRSRLNVAVAAGPHVTNRVNLLCAMQTLEAASIIGLIRRTTALRGHVSTVAGVLALFRRDPVLQVGGFRRDMATEDIDLTWRLLMAGWHTAYEPEALIGMQVPDNVRALWAQRRRWARGLGEVQHTNFRRLLGWRHRAMWPIALESILSLVWVLSWALAILLAAIAAFVPGWDTIFGLAIAWGVAIAVVCTFQLAFALLIESRADPRARRAFLLGPVYPAFFWAVSALAALREQLWALVRGPVGTRVVWDLERDPAKTSPR